VTLLDRMLDNIVDAEYQQPIVELLDRMSGKVRATEAKALLQALGMVFTPKEAFEKRGGAYKEVMELVGKAVREVAKEEKCRLSEGTLDGVALVISYAIIALLLETNAKAERDLMSLREKGAEVEDHKRLLELEFEELEELAQLQVTVKQFFNEPFFSNWISKFITLTWLRSVREPEAGTTG